MRNAATIIPAAHENHAHVESLREHARQQRALAERAIKRAEELERAAQAFEEKEFAS